MDWEGRAKQLKFSESASWKNTATAIQDEYFPNDEWKDVYDRVRGYLRRTEAYKSKNNTNKQEVIGVIGDTHFPFVHPNYINFLEDTFRKYRVTRIIHCGDLCDNHAISRWQTETDAYDANTEFELAQKNIEIYTRAFPKMDVLLGNHCMIPERQCATLGIPKQFLKGFKELWSLPDGWKVNEQLIINDVLYEHGIGCSGKNAALDKAVNTMMSCVIGHIHSHGGCQYRSNSKTLIFGMNVGCGIDIDRYAFRYGKYNKNRETLGCGIVFNSSNAVFVPTDMKYFRGNR